eukprot:jgi/Mesvir1/10824/Mv07752-RA.1
MPCYGRLMRSGAGQKCSAAIGEFVRNSSFSRSLFRGGMVCHLNGRAFATDGRDVADRGARNSVDSAEVAKFSALADDWWNVGGPMAPLHAMNPARCSFIRSSLCRHFGLDAAVARPLRGLRVVDIGCGPGVLCEPLARMGAHVVGVDATERSVQVAAAHAARDPQTRGIEYRVSTAEELVERGEQFDAVCSLEVVEHVTDVPAFVASLSHLVRPGGGLVMSTISRTLPSYALAILAAERLLRMVPPGTHDWTKFVTPEELARLVQDQGLAVQEVAGLMYNPMTGKWSLGSQLSINYIMMASKAALSDIVVS